MRPRPVRSSAACARSCHGRRVPAPTARAVRPHQPRNPHRASVSSALAAQETRLAAGNGASRRAMHPPPRQKHRRARPLLSRQARPRARRSRRAPAPAPQPTPRKRFERPQGARNAAPRTATLTTPEPTFPHPPSEVWRAAALQNAFRIPGAFPKSSIWRRNPARARDRLPASSGWPASLTCAVDSAALRQQGYLTPAAACAEGKRVPCGHLREAQSDPQA